MKITFKKSGITSEEINHLEGEKMSVEINHVVLEDSEGNRYRIKADKFGGIEVMVEDGSMTIEPNVSNVVTIKTLK